MCSEWEFELMRPIGLGCIPVYLPCGLQQFGETQHESVCSSLKWGIMKTLENIIDKFKWDNAHEAFNRITAKIYHSKW